MYSNLPSLDLHGETREISRILVNEFIDEQYNLGYDKVIIIHGKGTGLLRKEVKETLKKNKKVKDFKIDFFNDGCTVVYLDIKTNLCYNNRYVRGGY